MTFFIILKLQRNFYIKNIISVFLSDEEIYSSDTECSDEEGEIFSSDEAEFFSDSSDGESKDDNENSAYDDNDLLYTGSRSTVYEYCVAIIALKLLHKLSDACIDDLLKFVSHISPEHNKCISSLFVLKKRFAVSKIPLKKHFFCAFCKSPLQCETAQCS